MGNSLSLAPSTLCYIVLPCDHLMPGDPLYSCMELSLTTHCPLYFTSLYSGLCSTTQFYSTALYSLLLESFTPLPSALSSMIVLIHWPLFFALRKISPHPPILSHHDKVSPQFYPHFPASLTSQSRSEAFDYDGRSEL